MALKALDKVLLNPDQANELREDVANWKRQVDRAIHSYDPSTKRISVQETQERIRRVEKQLAEEAADGDLTPSERTMLAAQEKDLRAQITQGMLDEETMRKCPSDAPNRHIAWERHNIQKIMRWKNIRQQLDPENNEAQNLEVFRPRGAQGYGYRSDAVIAGKMSYGSVPQEHWDATFETKPDSALEQAKRADAAKTRKPLSEEAKAKARANLDRAREARRIKKMAAAHGEPVVEVDVSKPFGGGETTIYPVTDSQLIAS